MDTSERSESKNRSHRTSSRRREKDRSAKARARKSDGPAKVGAVAVGVVGNSKEDKKQRSSRRHKEDKEAKDRAKSSRRSEADHDAKRRARPSSRSISPKPGAVASSSKSDRASRKATPGAVSASPKSDRASRKAIPGAVSASHTDRASKREMDKGKGSVMKSVSSVSSSTNDRIRQKILEEDDGKEATITLPPLAENNQEETTLVAEAVDEYDEENAHVKKLASENERLRQQMNQIQDERNQGNEEPEPTEPKKKAFFNRYVVCAIVLLLIGGGAAAGVLVSGGGSDEDPVVPTTSTNPTLGPTFITATNVPTDLTSDPTGAPTTDQLYNPPSLADCAAIMNGEPVEDQENMSVRNFQLLMDVSLVDGLELDNTGVTEVETKTRENLLPELVGCPIERRALAEKGLLERRLASVDFIIGDAKIVAEYEVGGSCDDGTDDPGSCFRLIFRLEIFLKGNEGIYLIGRILEVFGTDSLVQKLGLDEASYQAVILASVTTLEETGVPSFSPSAMPSASPTDAPSKSPSTFPTPAPSSNPTLAPVIGPTTSEPTDLPSSVSSHSPTGIPTSLPTKVRTLAPSIASSETLLTMNPTVSVSGTPTSTPSNLPSSLPSRAPSSMPSGTPSFLPSNIPSASPSKTPTDIPSARPSAVPSSTPSTSEPSFRPSETPVDLVTGSALFTSSSFRTTTNDSGPNPLTAEKANDGAYNYGSCFRSRDGAGQWWQVDLGLTGTVTSITVSTYNSNAGAWAYIKGSLLELLDINGNVLSTTTLTLGETRDIRDETVTFEGGGVENVASVKITKTLEEGDLYVCEVEVVGYIQ
ncbi:unnamed protein product [Cylindrotheca closterium]|uniref:Circumsporozoite protein n=1 Tax=Cylindrotheca closterium TaxID=2856 RepID=A0AAD2FIA2_9STRA|nr:unnamed protein product [Cylindrotheca closterium]